MLKNINQFVRTIIDWDAIADATHNQFLVVGATPYADKKGRLPDGYRVTCQVRIDDHDYGVDKNGVARESNLYENFDVTVLARKQALKKGDIIRLLDFDTENSFAIGFDLILRFRDYEVLQPKAAKTSAN